MDFYCFTNKQIRVLNDSLAKIAQDLRTLAYKSEKTLWTEDLDALEAAYTEF